MKGRVSEKWERFDLLWGLSFDKISLKYRVMARHRNHRVVTPLQELNIVQNNFLNSFIQERGKV